MVGYFVGVFVILGVAGGAFWLWRRKVLSEIAEGAGVEYTRLQKTDPALLAGLDEDRFRAIFHHVEMPRFPAYALGALATFLIGTPLMLGLLGGIDYFMNSMGLIPEPADVTDRYFIDEDGSLRGWFDNVEREGLQAWLDSLGGFFYYFGLLFFWLLIFWAFMSRYHKRAPGTLRDEIIRAR